MALIKDPPVYRMSVEWVRNRDLDLPEVRDPFRGLLVKKDLTLEVGTGKYFWVTFRVIHCFSKSEKFGDSWYETQTKQEVAHYTAFDREHPELRTDMENLASGDLRGRAEESTVHKLFWELLVKRQYGKLLEMHFPHTFEFYQGLKHD